MKFLSKIILNTGRLIAGPEEGYFGEGNTQWYYIVSLAINLLLSTIFFPQSTFTFFLLSLVHFVMVCIFSYKELLDEGEGTKGYMVFFFIVSAILLIIAFINNWLLAIISAVITSALVLFAPFYAGFWNGKYLHFHPGYAVLVNCMLLAVFMACVWLAPIAFWVKIVLTVSYFILHPIVDCLEGECISIELILDSIFSMLHKDRNVSETKYVSPFSSKEQERAFFEDSQKVMFDKDNK
jgi:hypothetical protein